MELDAILSLFADRPQHYATNSTGLVSWHCAVFKIVSIRVCVLNHSSTAVDDGLYGDLDALEAVITNRLTLHQQEALATLKRPEERSLQ